jgi:hypothetical protein
MFLLGGLAGERPALSECIKCRDDVQIRTVGGDRLAHIDHTFGMVSSVCSPFLIRNHPLELIRHDTG